MSELIIYISPLGRAEATAQIIVEQLPSLKGIATDDRLTEVDLGKWDGLTQAKQTLGEIVPQFIELYAKPNTKGWKGTHSLLQKFYCLFSKPIDEITRGDVVRELFGIVANGTPIRANRALAATKKS